MDSGRTVFVGAQRKIVDSLSSAVKRAEKLSSKLGGAQMDVSQSPVQREQVDVGGENKQLERIGK